MKTAGACPEIADLVARAAVRRAAVQLARALMREGGVRVRDLVPQEPTDEPPRPFQRAGRQLVTRGKSHVCDALRPAGAVGLSLQALMAVMDKPLKDAHTRMAYYERIGMVWRRRHERGALHYVLTEVCAPIEGEVLHKGDVPPRQTKGLVGVPESMRPKLPPRPKPKVEKKPKTTGPELSEPQERPLDRAIRLSGAGVSDRKTPPPNETVKVAPHRLAKDAEVVIPAHVQVQRCPGLNHDPRYQIDPTTFTGGDFTAEWDAKRRGGRR